MASVSISLTVGAIEDNNPENVTVGALAPGVGDVEIRVNTANVTSLKQIYLAWQKFDDFIRDSNYGPSTFKVL